MQMTFSSEAAAKAAVEIIESYGYRATATGSIVRTDCPPLLAVPVVGRDVGLHQMEKVRFGASGERVGAAACSSRLG